MMQISGFGVEENVGVEKYWKELIKLIGLSD
jgi:hypothetical protein